MADVLRAVTKEPTFTRTTFVSSTRITTITDSAIRPTNVALARCAAVPKLTAARFAIRRIFRLVAVIVFKTELVVKGFRLAAVDGTHNAPALKFQFNVAHRNLSTSKTFCRSPFFEVGERFTASPLQASNCVQVSPQKKPIPLHVAVNRFTIERP